MTATSVKVRVQALGGKFLGDDIGGALVTIRDAQTGEFLASGSTAGDSGNLGPAYSCGASLFTIATPVSATESSIQWLSPDSRTAEFSVVLDLDRPRLLSISAFGPGGGLQSSHQVTTTEWFVPGQAPAELGLVLVLPGLLVQVMQPATHTTFGSSQLPTPVPIQACVAMMCGCPIDQVTNNPWIPSDFDVHADIHQVNAPGAATFRVPLNFTGVASLFEGLFTFIPGDQSVFYEVVVTAQQLSTGNIGTGTVTFFVKP